MVTHALYERVSVLQHFGGKTVDKLIWLFDAYDDSVEANQILYDTLKHIASNEFREIWSDKDSRDKIIENTWPEKFKEIKDNTDLLANIKLIITRAVTALHLPNNRRAILELGESVSSPSGAWIKRRRLTGPEILSRYTPILNVYDEFLAEMEKQRES